MPFVLTPVEDPSVWRPADIDLDHAVLKLSSEHLNEIDAAITKCEGKKIEEITKNDFPLPTLGTTLAAHIHSRIEGGRGFAMLRGLPTKRWGEEKSRIAMWGLGTHYGSMEKQDGAGNMLHDVKDHHDNKASNLAEAMAKDSKVRGFQTNAALPFHTDGCDMFALLCISQGRVGGSTSVRSATEAFNQIVTKRPDLAQVLQEDWHFDARGQRADGAKCQVHPIFHFYKGKLNMVHKQPYILSAQNYPEVPRLTAIQKEALAMLEDTLNQKEAAIELNLQPGEVRHTARSCGPSS